MPDQRAEIIDLIVSKAHEYGIEPWELLGGAIAESNLDPTAYRDGPWPDKSPGLFQQTIKFADEGDHTDSPENIALLKRLYSDPVHACDVAAKKFLYWRHNPDVPALTAWVAYNSPGFYHTPEQSPNVENYRRGLAEAQAMLGADPVPTYNLDLPIQTQNHDWDCAEQSTLWGVTAAGRHPSDSWMENQMLADGIESSDLGLLDGSGAALAAWITRQYSDPSEGSPTLQAHNASPVSFDEVRAVAGTAPVLLGGHHWGAAGHWTGVRGYDAAQDSLVLANPGGAGPMYGWQTMSRQQFESISPCSMVMITTAGAAPVEPPPPDPAPTGITRDEIDTLIATLTGWRERIPA